MQEGNLLMFTKSGFRVPNNKICAVTSSNEVNLLIALGLHPLFGPQSGRDGISGMRVAMCPVRIGKDRYYKVCDFLTEKLGLLCLKTSPEQHDREMARVQAMTHFMSRALKKIGLQPSPMATKAYEKLQEFAAIVLSDSWDLFLTIQNGNPFAEEIRQDLMRELETLEADITKIA